MKLVLTIVDEGAVRRFDAIERDIMEMAVAACGNNRAAAAAALGISRSTLHRKLGPQAPEQRPVRKNTPHRPSARPRGLKGVVQRGGSASFQQGRT
jgi:hypothetical protein